jgi:hypothetical protein
MTNRSEAEGKHVPAFRDEAEAAEFWDTHSPLDYPETFRETDVRFDRPAVKRGLTIKLSEETIAKLRALAHDRGIGPTTLARMWILEHLKGEENQASRGRRS